MSRVLVLSSASPIPVIDGAAIGVFQKLSLFSSLGFDVDCAYIESKKVQKKAQAEDLQKYCDNVFRFGFNRGKAYLNVFWGLFTNRNPLQVNYFYCRNIQKWIDENIHNYDLVWCMEIRMSEYVKSYRKKVILDYIDCISENCKISINNSRGLWKIINYIEAKRCRRYEKQVAPFFDTRVAITEHDKKRLFPNNEFDCHVLPNYVNIEKNRSIIQEETDNRIVFVGSMFYAPNVVAALYFVHEVLPLIISELPSIKFYIVGNRPTKDLLALQSENVIVTGFVDDVWEYLKKASVIVVPMQTGSGLQNKILEGLSVKGCVVTTKVCASGLVKADGMPFVAETPEEMSSIILKLIREREFRTQVGEKAFKYVSDNYSFEVVANKLKEIIEDFISHTI